MNGMMFSSDKIMIGLTCPLEFYFIFLLLLLLFFYRC